MSYQELLSSEGILAQVLVIMRPARKVSSWTLHSGSIYYNAFDYGFVTGVSVNGVALTEAASYSLSAGEFYWDNDFETLYIRTSDSANPSTKFVTVTYEIYVSNIDGHWYRDPLDETSLDVYYEPLIARAPTVKSTVKDLVFGIMPVQSTGMVLNNADKVLNRHVYDSSFKGREVLVYHVLDELNVDNIKLIMRGRMDSVAWNDLQVSIKIFDSFDEFNNEFRPPQGSAFYTTESYPNLDTNFIGKPIRYVYGIANGFVPVNLDYNPDAATTGNNRTWGVCSDGLNQYQRSATVPASPASSATGTFVDDATGLSEGDTVRIIKATPESRALLTVDYTNNYVTHAALSSGNASGGSTVFRGTVARVDIVQQGKKYTALYGRDYTESVDVSGTVKFTFVSALESNLSMPNTLSPNDTIYCRVYGKRNNVTLNGPAYGSNDDEAGNLMNLPGILLDVVKRGAGIPESRINIDSFTELAVDSDDRLGFAIPDESQNKFPKLKEIIADICQTGLVSFYVDDDLKWAASRLKPLAAASGEIDNTEILENSFSYDFDYSDIYSDVVVSYAKREKSESGINASSKTAKASSETAQYLHSVNKTLEVDSLHYDDTHASRLATRLAAFYGDRQGLVEFETKNRFFGFTIDEIITVNKESLPGFAYTEGTEQSVDLNIRSTEKSLRRVKLSLNDLKGITASSGEF